MKVWWSFFTYRYWTLYLAATDVGLCRITLPNESFLTLKQWLDRHIHDNSSSRITINSADTVSS